MYSSVPSYPMSNFYSDFSFPSRVVRLQGYQFSPRCSPYFYSSKIIFITIIPIRNIELLQDVVIALNYALKLSVFSLVFPLFLFIQNQIYFHHPNSEHRDSTNCRHCTLLLAKVSLFSMIFSLFSFFQNYIHPNILIRKIEVLQIVVIAPYSAPRAFSFLPDFPLVSLLLSPKIILILIIPLQNIGYYKLSPTHFIICQGSHFFL